MAEPDLIAKYMMLTNSSESVARYMLTLYNGDLNFAVNQHYAGYAPTAQDILSGVVSGVDLPLTDDQLLEIEKQHLADIILEPEDTSGGMVHDIDESAACYLDFFQGNVGNAYDSLLQPDICTTNSATQKYFEECGDNLYVAMHKLIEEGNKVKNSDPDDQVDVFKVAKVYLHYFEDIQSAINTLLVVYNFEASDVNTGLTKEAETYLQSLDGNFDLAFNILLEVYEPDNISISSKDNIDDSVNIYNAANDKCKHTSDSTAESWARTYLKTFDCDSKKAVIALLEVRNVECNDLNQYTSLQRTSTEIFLESFGNDFDLALSTLLDVSDNDEQFPMDVASSANRTDNFQTVEPAAEERFDGSLPAKSNCPCGNKDPMNMKHYFYHQKVSNNTEFIGIFCKRCDNEYVISDVLNSDAEHGDMNHHSVFELFGRRLYRKQIKKPEDNSISKEMADKFTPVKDLSGFKRGDHFAIQRPLYKHHGIVNHVEDDGKQFEGIHLQKGCARIIKDMIVVGEQDNLHKYNYGNSTRSQDDVKLVIARACSMIGDVGYNVFNRNCEHFARFCQTGIRESFQVDTCIKWITDKAKALITSKNLNAAYTFFATVYKGTGKALEETKYVDGGIIIVVEGIQVIIKIIEQRKSGEITLVGFVESLFTTIVGGMIDVALKIGRSIAGGKLGACIGTRITADGKLNTKTAMLVGTILGGNVGTLTQQTLGNVIGDFLGNILIRKLIPYDDSLVRDVSDLQNGDHVVFYATIVHPRCHGIVIDHNNISHMTLVRSTHDRGVIEEEKKFVLPIYRVIYSDDQSRNADETISRALSKLGTNDYNLLTNNCKHFCQWCKVR